MKIIPIKRALLSVSDKTGVVEFAQALVNLGIEIISTGGTSKLLQEAQIPFLNVDEITQMPEMLEGRVKTLHPKIHGGILGRRDTHANEAEKHGIKWIDLVVVNFYPFSQAVANGDLSFAQAIEYIDVGGPTMVRAAAKNFAWVGVVSDPGDYSSIISALKTQGGLDETLRKDLAHKAFAMTSYYDAEINRYFSAKKGEAQQPPQLKMELEKKQELRYGENPHQKASAYQFKGETHGILSALLLQGKPLSFNNILDSEAAYSALREFSQPTCVIIKHANPCGVASAAEIDEAFHRAYHADSLSAFGGIIALNRTCTKAIAEVIANVFMEVVIAPDFDKEALALLATKPNLRLLTLPMEAKSQIEMEMKFIAGGVLLQERDQQRLSASDLQVVTAIEPHPDAIDEMLFAWRIVKHVKSNAILLTKNRTTLGIGAGQVSRIDSVDIALRKAKDQIKGAVLASDAFFPFRDSIDRIANTGVSAIIQPGGSLRDQEVIEACNQYGIAMVFTGKRCFKH